MLLECAPKHEKPSNQMHCLALITRQNCLKKNHIVCIIINSIFFVKLTGFLLLINTSFLAKIEKNE